MIYYGDARIMRMREIRVRAVTRYVVTDYVAESRDKGDWDQNIGDWENLTPSGNIRQSSSRVVGEFDNPVRANEVAAALAADVGGSYEPVYDPSWSLPPRQWPLENGLHQPEKGSPAAERAAKHAEAARMHEAERLAKLELEKKARERALQQEAAQ